MNVDKLVQEGYLVRRAVAGDRRKTELLCTEKAEPVIEQGRRMQEAFFRCLVEGVEEAQLEAFHHTLEMMGRNLDRMLEGES